MKPKNTAKTRYGIFYVNALGRIVRSGAYLGVYCSRSGAAKALANAGFTVRNSTYSIRKLGAR
jgi:hypothetical protein